LGSLFPFPSNGGFGEINPELAYYLIGKTKTKGKLGTLGFGIRSLLDFPNSGISK